MHSIAWWPTVVVLGISTFTDIRSRKIPNLAVFPFMAAGPIVNCYLHGWSGLLTSLEGFALAALLFGIPCLMGGMGMGDVKLCAAIGAWVGPMQMFVALVLTGIVGGVMAFAWALAGGFLGELFKGTGDLVFRTSEPGDLALSNPKARSIPYAPAIAIGVLISFFSA